MTSLKKRTMRLISPIVSPELIVNVQEEENKIVDSRKKSIFSAINEVCINF